MAHKIRVLVGKPGLDGHDRGAKVVAAALRDAGMEVIYTGLHQTPEQIVEAAVQEDVDVVALSILSGAHMTLFPEVLEGMRARGIDDKLLTGGGIIPPEDMTSLAKMGVGRLFGPGASTQDIAEYIRSWYSEARGEEAYAAVGAGAGASAGGSRQPATAAAPARAARASTPSARKPAARGSAKTSSRKAGTRARAAGRKRR
jgi:methylmalonyl-CoA mutase C-terminal domain/subunit